MKVVVFDFEVFKYDCLLGVYEVNTNEFRQLWNLDSIRNYYKENKKYPKSNIDFYLYGREIGSGAFGKVNIALHIGSGRLVAIKIFE